MIIAFKLIFPRCKDKSIGRKKALALSPRALLHNLLLIETRYQSKYGFFEVNLAGGVNEAYNWNAIQAWFFVRISRQSHTKPHLSRDAYKNSPLGKHLRARISSVHETAPWCHKMRPFIRLNITGRKYGHKSGDWLWMGSFSSSLRDWFCPLQIGPCNSLIDNKKPPLTRRRRYMERLF